MALQQVYMGKKPDKRRGRLETKIIEVFMDKELYFDNAYFILKQNKARGLAGFVYQTIP